MPNEPLERPSASFSMPTPSVRVAGIALRGTEVLLHRRRGESFWALPGGRVDIGETAASALLREFHEELACTAVCGNLVYVVENFFAHAGSSLHEVGLYFPVELQPTSAAMQAVSPFTGPEVELEFQWFPRKALMSANLRPSFLVHALAGAELEFQHVVEHRAAGI